MLETSTPSVSVKRNFSADCAGFGSKVGKTGNESVVDVVVVEAGGHLATEPALRTRGGGLGRSLRKGNKHRPRRQ